MFYKYCVLFFFICFHFISQGQATWFKHLPGYHARNSVIKGDTIISLGETVSIEPYGYKFNAFLSYNNIKKDSIGLNIISLDSIEMDTTRSTAIASFFSGIVLSINDIKLPLTLSFGNGQKKERTFLFSFWKFSMKQYNLTEFTVDSFASSIDEVLNFRTDYLTVVRYISINNQQIKSLNTVICKGNSKRKIKEYRGLSSESFQTSHYLKNNLSDASFFFKFRKNWNYLGDPQQWEDYIIKMDTSGKELWKTKPYDDYRFNPVGMNFVQKSNGNLLVSWVDRYYRPYLYPYGQSQNYQPNRQNTLWFSEIDSSGNILVKKNITKFLQYKLKRDSSSNIQIEKALPVNDGVLWVGYNTWYYRHAMLLKTDYSGNPIWLREYELYPSNTAKNEFLPTDIVQTSDNGFVITGEYTSSKGNIFPDGIQKGTILKVDSFGCLEPGCQLKDSIPQEDTIKTSISSFHKKTCKIYPNPTNSVLNIDFDGNEEYHLKLISIDGKVEIESFAKNKTVVNIEQIKSGVYFLYLYNQSRSIHEVHKVAVINN